MKEMSSSLLPARSFVSALSLVVMLFVCSSWANAQEATLHYRLSFEGAAQHYIDVEVEIEKPDEKTELMMAVWTPGSYLVREYARHIDDVEALGPEGEVLTVEKTSKNRWTIDCAGVESATVKYRVYCRELSVRTNFVDHDFAVLNGAATFLTMPSRLGEPHLVTVDLPDHWKRAVTGLDNAKDQAEQFIAHDFDELVDSPILVGNPSLYPFEVDGRQHFLVNIGDDSMWNGAKAAADVAKIVQEHQNMWGTVPYSRYTFLNVIAESGGGLEHDDSTLMLTSRWSFGSASSYQRWLGLVSHEYFHAWNIRTLRPKVLVEYDYEAENYFPSLWIAEGITSYYDDLALVRAGFVDQRKHLSALSRQISSVQGTPGRLVQSLNASSHDAWIKYYRSNENTSNTEISYYSKGAVVAFLLDMKIRELTNNEKSLDNVMRLCYERFSGDVGYTEDEFRAVASEVAGADLTDWFVHAVDTSKELDYGPALAFLGLKFPGFDPSEKEEDEETEASDDENGDEGKASADAAKPEPPAGKPYTGFSASDDNGRWVVSRVRRGSPAFEAGINVDDEILAINDYRVSSSNFDRALGVFDLGETVELLIARRGRLMRLTFPLRAEERKSWTLSVIKEPSDEQKARLESWLKASVPPEG